MRGHALQTSRTRDRGGKGDSSDELPGRLRAGTIYRWGSDNSGRGVVGKESMRGSKKRKREAPSPQTPAVLLALQPVSGTARS